jgi:Tol biopolymer transport system component
MRAIQPSVLNDKTDWKLTPISTEQATGYELSWTEAGQLVQLNGARHVYVTAADGSRRVRLLEDDEYDAFVTACGKSDAVMVSRLLNNDTVSLWRLNPSTGELKRITNGDTDQAPSCTPDGKWVIYTAPSSGDNAWHIFKVSTDGGAPVEVSDTRRKVEQAA